MAVNPWYIHHTPSESAPCTAVVAFTKVNVSFMILSKANRDVI